MKFSPTFLFDNIEVYDPLIRNFQVCASDKRVRIFSRALKLGNSSQNVRHSARGQNMQISPFDVIRCVKPSSHHSIWGEEATEWEVFRYRRACFSELQNTTYTEGTVLLIFRKTKSEEHIVSDLFGYTGPTAKRRMCPCCPSISNKVSIDGFWTPEILCNGDVLIKI